MIKNKVFNLNKVQVFANFRILDSMKSCIAIFSTGLFIFIFSIPTFSQKGINLSVSSGYRIGFSHSTPQNRTLENISPLVDYGKGVYASFGCSFTTEKVVEWGTIFTYHQSTTEIIYDLLESHSSYKLKANTFSTTPYIRLRKSVTGPFIPYIHFGLPLTFAEALNVYNSTTKDGKIAFSQNYYPRKLAVGINGGIGFYAVMSNHWQMFFEANVIGVNLTPIKLYFYSYSTGNPTTQGITELNTKDEKEVNGNTVKLPFSNVGFGLGIRYNISKMIESL